MTAVTLSRHVMGRPPLGERPKTAAERQRERRQRLAEKRDVTKCAESNITEQAVTEPTGPESQPVRAENMAMALLAQLGANGARQLAEALLLTVIWNDLGRPADFNERHADTCRLVRWLCVKFRLEAEHAERGADDRQP